MLLVIAFQSYLSKHFFDIELFDTTLDTGTLLDIGTLWICCVILFIEVGFDVYLISFILVMYERLSTSTFIVCYRQQYQT